MMNSTSASCMITMMHSLPDIQGGPEYWNISPENTTGYINASTYNNMWTIVIPAKESNQFAIPPLDSSNPYNYQ
jgi:hypothetical protein